MSDVNNPPPTPGPPRTAPLPPLPPRSGWITAFMVIVGIILLLPGLCALGFGVFGLLNPNGLNTIMPFVLIGLLVGFGGVMLIRAAIRGPQR
jgi:hypothetical protein